MKKLVNISIILCLMMALFLGAKDLFTPIEMAHLYGLNLNGILAINTFRAVIGGTILSMALMLLLGLFTKNKTWYQSTLLVAIVILVCRTYSVIVDGYMSEMLSPILVEVFIIVTMFFGIKHLNANESNK